MAGEEGVAFVFGEDDEVGVQAQVVGVLAEEADAEGVEGGDGEAGGGGGADQIVRRSAISAAALLVKVMARMDSGATPWARRWAMRMVRVRVLPVPGPAVMTRGASTTAMAAAWSGLRGRERGRQGDRELGRRNRDGGRSQRRRDEVCAPNCLF